MCFHRRSAADVNLIDRAARGDLLEIQQEIESGGAEFFSLGQCHFVTRAEQTTRGRELVIVCAQGQDLRPPLKRIIGEAIRQKFDCLRYHPATKTSGLALARMAGRPVTWFSEGYYITDLR